MTDVAADATVGAVTVDRSCADLVMCIGADGCVAEPEEVCAEVDDAGGAVDRTVDGDDAAIDVDAAVGVVVVVDDVVVVTALGVTSVGGCAGAVGCADDVACRSRAAAVRARVRGESTGGGEPAMFSSRRCERRS